MDETTQEDIRDMSTQIEEELTSPTPPKQPRTDWANRFDYSETPQKTNGSLPSIRTERVWPAECGDMEDEKPLEQEDIKLTVTSINNLTTSHADDASSRSSKASFITAERHFLLLAKDEQPQVTECDRLSSYLLDDAGGALAESHTSRDASADTASHPDCKQLRESLEHEPTGGCNLPPGNGKDGRWVQNSVSQIQAFSHSSPDEEVRCRTGCTHEEMLNDTGLCNTWRQSAEVEGSNQKRDKRGFNENIILAKKKEEGTAPITDRDYADTKSFCPNAEEVPSGNLQGVKNEGKKFELQICEIEDAVCEIKSQFNENGLSKNATHCAAECADGSIVPYDLASTTNIANENVTLPADVFCGAGGDHAAGKMIAKACSKTADDTAETLMLARLSQEPAEGDNDVGPFSVIDPAIWSETDSEAEEAHCNSESTAGAELSPSVKVCEMEMPLPLCSDVRPSEGVSVPDRTQQLNHRSRTRQCKDQKKDVCQSCTELQPCSITRNRTQKPGEEGRCLWKFSPSSSSKPPPAEDGGRGGLESAGHWLKVQDQSSCFPVSLKTQEAEHLQIARMDGPTEIKQRDGKSLDAHRESDERLLQQNENHENTTKILTGVGWTSGELSKYGNKCVHIDEGNNLERLTDHPYCAVITRVEGITEENESKDETSFRKETDGSSAILATSEDGHQQQRPKLRDRKASPDDGIGEWTEGNMSNANKSTPVRQHKPADKLSSYSKYHHKAETFMSGNKDDCLASNFPATRDAVVPGLQELTLSQHAYSSPTALNHSDRYSPVPSAFSSCDHTPRGFDTFKRIQLSFDDDDDSLSNSPHLTSLAEQLLKTPRQLLYQSMPEAERASDTEVIPEEEEEEDKKEVGNSKCHTQNMTNVFLSSEYSCNEVPNLISAANLTTFRWPEQQPDNESACSSSESVQDDLNPQSSESPALHFTDSPKFEMKKQYDLVLKELNLYFDISVSDFASSGTGPSPKRCSDVTKPIKDRTSNYNDQLSSQDLRHHGDASSDDADEDRSLDMCGGDPALCRTSGSGDGEQEVPLGSHLCQEASVSVAEKNREPLEMELKGKMWSPSFVCRPFLEQLSHTQLRRLEPLRTCTRPIRVGLSKRAKTKELHRPHPYR